MRTCPRTPASPCGAKARLRQPNRAARPAPRRRPGIARCRGRRGRGRRPARRSSNGRPGARRGRAPAFRNRRRGRNLRRGGARFRRPGRIRRESARCGRRAAREATRRAAPRALPTARAAAGRGRGNNGSRARLPSTAWSAWRRCRGRTGGFPARSRRHLPGFRSAVRPRTRRRGQESAWSSGS